MKRYFKILAITTLAGLFSVLAFDANSTELVKNTIYSIETDTKAEAPLEIEDWMSGNLLVEHALFMYESEDKKEMKIEKWMSDDSNWMPNEDGELQIEEWMTDDDYWTVN